MVFDVSVYVWRQRETCGNPLLCDFWIEEVCQDECCEDVLAQVLENCTVSGWSACELRVRDAHKIDVWVR